MIVVASSSARSIKAGVHLFGQFRERETRACRRTRAFTQYSSPERRGRVGYVWRVFVHAMLVASLDDEERRLDSVSQHSITYFRIPVFPRRDHRRRMSDVLEQIDSCRERSTALFRYIGLNVGIRRREIMHTDSSTLYIHWYQSPACSNRFRSMRCNCSHCSFRHCSNH